MRRRAILLLMALAAAMIVVGGVAYAATFTCDSTGDQDPDPGQCTGTEEADQITGTQNADTIKALAGNDLADAGDGNDTIYGGPDGDGSAQGAAFSAWNLEGAEDSDTIYGGGGSDWIDAAHFDTTGSVDSSFGGRGNDHIYAVDHNKDIINCGKGRADEVEFDFEIDTIRGCEQKTAVSD